MDFPNPSKSAGNLVESIKDKLHFGSSRNADREEDYEFDDYAYEDDFDDYGEYGYDESYADPGYDDAYSTSYTTRDPYRSGSPRLVSLDDIQSTTSAYGVMTPGSSGVAASSSVPGYLSSSADSRFASRSTARSTSRVTVAADDPDVDYTEGFGFDRPDTSYRDFVSPYQRQDADKTAAMPSTGSSGLDGLFTPTDASSQAANTQVGSSNSIGGRFSRKIEIFEPKSFEEAVNIVGMLKEGSVVILNLKYVNANLSKRVLDFAFGVVAALDAQIAYEAPQVFSIMQAGKLTLVERDQLRLKNVL